MAVRRGSLWDSLPAEQMRRSAVQLNELYSSCVPHLERVRRTICLHPNASQTGKCGLLTAITFLP